MNLKYFILFLVSLGVSALQYSTAQSTLNIISSDSTQLSLKVNDELITDSFYTEINLKFPFQQKVYLEFIDSTDQSVLKKTIALQPQYNIDYSLTNNLGSYNLNLLAQSTIEDVNINETAVRELAAVDMEFSSTESSTIATLNTIESEYNNPDDKQKVYIDSIDDFRFEQEKVKAVKSVLQSQNLPNSLINKALLKISYEDKRAQVILELKDEVKGKITKSDLDSLFKLSRYKTAVAAALEIQ